MCSDVCDVVVAHPSISIRRNREHASNGFRGAAGVFLPLILQLQLLLVDDGNDDYDDDDDDDAHLSYSTRRTHVCCLFANAVGQTHRVIVEQWRWARWVGQP